MYFQFFSGQVYFEPRLPCDPAQISRFRRVLGECGVEQLLKTTIETAVAIGAVKKSEFERVSPPDEYSPFPPVEYSPV